ncbi:MAG: large exoprotein [Mycetocola sp.]
MNGGGLLSGGIVFALAAALWIVYLLPTWLRRSEYVAVERNAIRLQQTLRILAETSEIPHEIRVEATAREVAEQQKILKQVEADARERARLEATVSAENARAAASAAIASLRAEPRVRLARARRRARLTATAILFVSILAATAGGWIFATTASPILLASAGATALLATGALVRMARITSRTKPIVVTVQKSETADVFVPVEVEADAPAATTWTPMPLPRPLHLSHGSAAAEAIAQADAHDALRRAALVQVMATRAAEQTPVVPTIAAPVVDQPAARTEAPSRFAGMGIVDETEIEPTDITAILQRRRVAS